MTVLSADLANQDAAFLILLIARPATIAQFCSEKLAPAFVVGARATSSQ